MNRSERATLPENNTQVVSLFRAGDAQCWRVIEAWSADGLPWELHLDWTLANGPGGNGARVSVSQSVRVCVFASDLKLSGLNRSTSPNHVGVAVANGFMPTANVLDSWQLCDGTTPVVFEVPPFAQRFDLQLGSRHLLNSTAVALIDGTGARIELSADALPAAGIGVGAVDRIEVLTPVSCQLRAIFMLSL